MVESRCFSSYYGSTELNFLSLTVGSVGTVLEVFVTEAVLTARVAAFLVDTGLVFVRLLFVV
jgi:hypothetical protein